MKKYLIALLGFVLTVNVLLAQESKVVDRVAAIVGSAIILQSDVDREYAQFIAQGYQEDERLKCYILQQQLTQKLLAQQAALDSIEISESELDDNINSRMRYMSSQAGGQERLERFLNRSLLQYKEEIRPSVLEQLKANRMQQTIIQGIDVTPLEVRRYFESIHPDSIKYYGSEVELGELVIYPTLTREEKQQFRERAENLRKQVIDGTDFATIARLYSDDKGSAINGGDLGFSTRDTFVKEFSAVAFRMKPGEISQVFESEFGFHFLQVLERRGEEIKTRHVLVSIKPTQSSMDRAKAKIDSIYQLVNTKKVDFYTAATAYSDNQMTKFNGGMMLNMENNSQRTTFIPVEKLNADLFKAIDTLEVGQYSQPVQFTGDRDKVGYRFIFLKSRTEPHKANLDQDFAKLKAEALDDKINRKLSEWFEGRRKVTYIHINENYYNCEELSIWIKDAKDKTTAEASDR